VNYCRVVIMVLLGVAWAEITAHTRAESLSAASARGEALGPSNRRTGLVISEIMFRPSPSLSGANRRFIELYNSQLWYEDLSGYSISGIIDFIFPEGTVIPAEGFLVIAENPADLRAVYGITNVLGPYLHTFKGDSGTLKLHNRAGAILWEMTYSSEPPWPVSADGAGHSLILRRPSYGEERRLAWEQSDQVGGSPGLGEPMANEPLRAIMLNEFQAQGQPDDFIELYNHSAESHDLGGCILTDSPATNRFVIPKDTTVTAGGFIVFEAGAVGFSLDPRGGVIYLKNAGETRVLDAWRYPPQSPGCSVGRSPDGSDFFRTLSAKTPSAPNAPAKAPQVVINEIMHSPISGSDEDEYVELYNPGPKPVALDHWRFTSGIKFEFPPGSTISPNGYVVVAKRAGRLLPHYPVLADGGLLGDFSGSLAGLGERLVLARPVLLTSRQAGEESPSSSEVGYVIEDEVTYGTGRQWGTWSDGGGSSLELVTLGGNHDLDGHWAASDETTKSQWTSIESTGLVDLTSPNSPADSLQIFLMGEGECLIDEVEVFTPGGSNRVVNAKFDTGLSGWTPQGSQMQSSWESGSGIDGSGALHVRSTHRGDTGANRIRTRLTASLARNGTVTIRAKARWLRGFPEVLLRLRGNGMEAPGQLSLPGNLGTPGQVNSRPQADSRPVLHAVTHRPLIPTGQQTVVVSAGADHRDRVSQLNLSYRIDPSTNFIRVAMNDSGTGGDDVANDSIFSAMIPGQASGVMVAFYVEASNSESSSPLSTFPPEAPLGECFVRFGDPQPTGRFGTYRLWLSQSNVNAWTSRTRPKLSNEPLGGTFVYGHGRVIYNMGAYFSGSPFHSPSYTGPTGTLCNYSLRFPEDDSFLGATDFKLTSPGNNPGDDDTAQREQTAYWMAAQLGLPYNYQRNVNLFINGVRRGKIFEDTQIPNSDFLAEWFPQSNNGDLYKIAGWFEFDEAAVGFETTWATLQRFLSGGRKKLARYRWNFQKRAVDLTTSNYTNLFALVDGLQTTGTDSYQAAVEGLVDVEQWMRIFALEHVVGNWDSYGNDNGQNMFAYKAPDGLWKLLIWDLDIVLGLGGYSDGPTSPLFKVADIAIDRMYKHPAFRRAYWRAIQDAVTGPLDSGKINPLLDAKQNAFVKNGATVTAPAGIKSFITGRRNYLLGQLKTVAATFDVTSRQGADFSTDQNFETITGTAPIQVKTLKANGVEYPIKWTTVTNWSMRVPLHPGMNLVRLHGFDPLAKPVPLASDTLNIFSSAALDPASNHLWINEWMSGNRTMIADRLDGQFKDWFEIYNPSTNVVDLSGFSLSDGDGTDRFILTTGPTIPGRGYLLVWADGKPQLNQQNEHLHVPFKLSQEGDQIHLFAPDGKVVDSVAFDPQEEDTSHGRRPNQPDLFAVMALPTPGEENQPEDQSPDILGIPLARPTVSKGLVFLTWEAEPGKTYHIQFKNDLNELHWRNLPGDILATGFFASKTNIAGLNQPQRFYRVQRVD